MTSIMRPFGTPMPNLSDNIDITFSNSEIEGHYPVTPYSFHPNMAHKLVLNSFIDRGQGLVERLGTMQDGERETSGTVDHQEMAGLLNDIGYTGYVSIEQKMIGEDDPLAALSQSVKILEEYYS